jgi:putative transposase
MKRLAGRQTRYVNVLEKRCGTLWEGMYKSSPIGDEVHLLACCRYVELNPVHAGIVEKPEGYRWSNYWHKAGFSIGDIVDFHTGYLSMEEGTQERQKSYRQLICETVPVWEWKLIREAVQRGQLTDPRKFMDEVESRLKIRVELRGRGRPRKDKK